MQLTKDYAMRFVGLPYRWGGDDPINGFDCSGLTIEILQSKGLLPRGFDAPAKGLYNHFLKQAGTVVGLRNLGALAFFGKSINEITHVGFMLDEKRMLEAGGGGSATTNDQTAANQNAFVRVRPLTWRKDLVAILMPNYEL